MEKLDLSYCTKFLTDPLYFKEICWPHVQFYDKQVEIIRSVEANDETIVPAGNMLGKDFIAAFIALWFFCSRTPCKVLTSSVDQPQLKGVLWGEIRRFIQTSRYKLPIQVNDLLIRQIDKWGNIEPLSYLMGRVVKKGEGMLGHHIARTDNRPRTLYLNDESSGSDDETWNAADTWAHRKLSIGNPYPCQNFFYKGCKEGDLRSADNQRYYRKVIKIKATDSPNVQLGLERKALGKDPYVMPIVPGVIDFATYEKRRATWDAVRQRIGLDAEFYEGADLLLYPPEWLDRAERIAANLPAAWLKPNDNNPRFMGVDTGEGGDDTVWCVIDQYRVIEMVVRSTPDTSVIPSTTLTLMQKYDIKPENVVFDRGGGGKQHADLMRARGFRVRTVGFGEAATDDLKDHKARFKQDEQDAAETRHVYKNRRAEMYHLPRIKLLDPIQNPRGFGIPAEYAELRRQLSVMPILYGDDGKIWLYPKDKPSPQYKGSTIKGILGRSPDHADAFVLAVFGMVVKKQKRMLGAY